ncbi:MAG: hypothetical protein ACLGG7_12715 [Bacteriovoracia bacterium]
MKHLSLSLLATCLILASCQSRDDSSKKNQTPLASPELTNEALLEGARSAKFSLTTTRVAKIKPDLSNLAEYLRQVDDIEFFLESSEPLPEAELDCKFNYKFDNQSFRASVAKGARSVRMIVDVSEGSLDALYALCSLATASDQLYSTYVVVHRAVVLDKSTSSSELPFFMSERPLVLLRGAELYFRTFPTPVTIQTFISDGGKISTFTTQEAESSAPGDFGFSGGAIKLQVGEAYGSVVFHLRGMDGGSMAKFDGQGELGRDGYSGRNGGDSGSVDLTVKQETDLSVAFVYAPGKGSAGALAPAATPSGYRGSQGARGKDGVNLSSSFKIEATGYSVEVSDSWSNVFGDL